MRQLGPVGTKKSCAYPPFLLLIPIDFIFSSFLNNKSQINVKQVPSVISTRVFHTTYSTSLFTLAASEVKKTPVYLELINVRRVSDPNGVV